MGELPKFEELRLKTDRDLLKLLNDDLDLGLAAAREALRSVDDLASATRSYDQAKRAYSEVSRLLPVAYEITPDERRRSRLRLNHLSYMIDALHPLEAGIHPRTEESVSLATAGEC